MGNFDISPPLPNSNEKQDVIRLSKPPYHAVPYIPVTTRLKLYAGQTY